jgi:hypothetical protein
MVISWVKIPTLQVQVSLPRQVLWLLQIVKQYLVIILLALMIVEDRSVMLESVVIERQQLRLPEASMV